MAMGLWAILQLIGANATQLKVLPLTAPIHRAFPDSTMRTSPAILAAALLIAASPACAQIFPGISAKDAGEAVKKAEGESSADATPTKTDAPEVSGRPETPTKEAPTASGAGKDQKELEKKYKEALASIRNEQTAVANHTKSLERGCYSDFKGFVSGLAEYHSGNFTRAAKSLSGFTPPQVLSDENTFRTRYWDEAKGGEGLLLGAMARCFAEFDPDVATESRVKSKFRQVADDARKSAKAIRDRIGAGNWDQTGLIDRASVLTRFADDGESVWLAAWGAGEKAKATPWDFDVVLSYARMLWVTARLELNIHQRVLLKYLADNFPEHDLVRNGEVAVLLAWNMVRTWQFDDAIALMDAAIEGNKADKDRHKSLIASRAAMLTERRRIERGLLKIDR
jgi:hypothetical protein